MNTTATDIMSFDEETEKPPLLSKAPDCPAVVSLPLGDAEADGEAPLFPLDADASGLVLARACETSIGTTIGLAPMLATDHEPSSPSISGLDANTLRV